nr:hypothetical protein [Sphingomonas sp.]
MSSSQVDFFAPVTIAQMICPVTESTPMRETTSTGRTFCVAESVNGNGTTTISPSSKNAIPFFVFVAQPFVGKRRADRGVPFLVDRLSNLARTKNSIWPKSPAQITYIAKVLISDLNAKYGRQTA